MNTIILSKYYQSIIRFVGSMKIILGEAWIVCFSWFYRNLFAKTFDGYISKHESCKSYIGNKKQKAMFPDASW